MLFICALCGNRSLISWSFSGYFRCRARSRYISRFFYCLFLIASSSLKDLSFKVLPVPSSCFRSRSSFIIYSKVCLRRSIGATAVTSSGPSSSVRFEQQLLTPILSVSLIILLLATCEVPKRSITYGHVAVSRNVN